MKSLKIKKYNFNLRKTDHSIFKRIKRQIKNLSDRESKNISLQLKEAEFKLKNPDLNIQFRMKKRILKVISLISKLALKFNQNNKHFPLWGTCQGFQMMALSFAEKSLNYDKFDDDRAIAHSLKEFIYKNSSNLQKNPNKKSFFNNTLYNSKVERQEFKKSRNSLGHCMKNTLKSSINNFSYLYFHHWGFTPSNFLSDPFLSQNFNILYTSDVRDQELDFVPVSYQFQTFLKKNYFLNFDHQKTEFVAAYEHRKYPFFGVQFHPEKYFYTLYSSDLPRLKDNYFFSRFFIAQAFHDQLKDFRKSNGEDQSKLINPEIKDNKFSAFNGQLEKWQDMFLKKIASDVLKNYSKGIFSGIILDKGDRQHVKRDSELEEIADFFFYFDEEKELISLIFINSND